jgi:hypothetical protein
MHPACSEEKIEVEMAVVLPFDAAGVVSPAAGYPLLSKSCAMMPVATATRT